MNREDLFKLGRTKCDELLSQYPGDAALLSVRRQIEYLIGLESGSISDRSRLKDIMIGVLTVREIESLDDAAAETFYQIAGEATRMLYRFRAGYAVNSKRMINFDPRARPVYSHLDPIVDLLLGNGNRLSYEFRWGENRTGFY